MCRNGQSAWIGRGKFGALVRVAEVVVVGRFVGGAIKWSAIEMEKGWEELVDYVGAGGACVLACSEVLVLKWEALVAADEFC